MSLYLKNIRGTTSLGVRFFQTSSALNDSCKLLVLGGGAGGCSMAAKFASKLGKNQVYIVDPADTHYYQPMFTLIGGGMKNLSQSSRPMASVLPKDAHWIKNAVAHIDPVNCKVTTDAGKEISYEYLIVALGLELKFDKVKGLIEALSNPDSGVGSNYSPKYVDHTFKALKTLKSGNAIFTAPITPIKCGGAPLKACYISDDYLRKEKRRSDVNVYFKTALPAVFTSKYYAQKLEDLFTKRGIDYAVRQELVEVKSKEKEAVFKMVDKPEKTLTLKYNMLHVTPPMFPNSVLKCDPTLHDAAGYLKVNKETLQHDTYPNIFGIGDCSNIPTSKTAAAVAAQSGVLYDNLSAFMNKGTLPGHYDGYTSCPLVTGYGKCIMAEFDFTLEPLETFPIDQSKENRLMFHMKKDVMPSLYWYAMMRGYWRGPRLVRKALHLGLGK